MRGGEFMKKAIGYIFGAIMTFIGLITILVCNETINTSRRYTFRPPLTEYEIGVLSTRFIGIALLVIGIVILIIMIVSSYYYSKNVQDISDIGNGKANFISCPVCNCKTTSDSEYCPKCNNKLR